MLPFHELYIKKMLNHIFPYFSIIAWKFDAILYCGISNIYNEKLWFHCDNVTNQYDAFCRSYKLVTTQMSYLSIIVPTEKKIQLRKISNWHVFCHKILNKLIDLCYTIQVE